MYVCKSYLKTCGTFSLQPLVTSHLFRTPCPPFTTKPASALCADHLKPTTSVLRAKMGEDTHTIQMKNI